MEEKEYESETRRSIKVVAEKEKDEGRVRQGA